MIYTVKDIVDKTNKGKWKITRAIITDGQNDYKVSFFNQYINVGDKVDGKLGEYKEQYKEYGFRVNKVITTDESKPSATSDDIRQSNIAFESFFASASNLLQKSGDVGKAIATAVQLHTYLLEGKWILLSTEDQHKKLVAKYGIDGARKVAYERYGKPYLHLLTFDEAEALLND